MIRLVSAVLFVTLAAAAQTEPTRDQLEEELDAYRRVLMDWGGLVVYGSDNAELKLREGEKRVVFLGDEITERWGRENGAFFAGKPYLNRGIARQTSAQMLVRFRQDVINLKPHAVVIQAGLNDIGGVMGPVSEGTYAEFIMSMVELAKAHNIRVVLASLTPVCDCFQPLTRRRSAARILAANRWLKEYAKTTGSIYLDYFTALAEGRLMKRELTLDGMIPNAAGYARMAPLAEAAIAEAESAR